MRHPPLLPLLPSLRDLIVRMHVMDRHNAAAGLMLDLIHLSSMCALTQLCVSTPDLRSGAADAAIVMRSVKSALPALTALGSLQLDGCVADERAEACWRELAHALPALTRLTSFSLQFIPVVEDDVAACLQTLSTGLARSASLRSLRITGEPEDNASEDPTRLAASKQLTLAIGTLTGLQSLALGHMVDYESAHDCYVHLRQLTALQQLVLNELASTLPSTWQGDGDGVDTLVGMLAGMTCLTDLTLRRITLTPRAALALVSVALPVLPQLQMLHMHGNLLDSAHLMVLARSMRLGQLPNLQEVLCDQPLDVLYDLNWLVQRGDVFYCDPYPL